MTDRKRNYVIGLILLFLSVVWTWLVIDTIPAGFGDGDIGPRAFPMMLGLCLGGLSVLLLLRSFVEGLKNLPENNLAAEYPTVIRWFPAGLLLVEMLAYGYLLKTVGFVISTPIVILLVMIVNLRIRSAKLLLGLSLGTTLVCWLIFEKILGIYLANGSWINLG